MNPRLRQERNVFLLFLGAAFVAIMAALPLLTATLAGNGVMAKRSAAEGSTSQQVMAPGFDQVDRNKDGFVDKSEAAVVPGLSANFERADTNKDGRLDKVEFAKGLAILDGKK